MFARPIRGGGGGLEGERKSTAVTECQDLEIADAARVYPLLKSPRLITQPTYIGYQVIGFEISDDYKRLFTRSSESIVSGSF